MPSFLPPAMHSPSRSSETHPWLSCHRCWTPRCEGLALSPSLRPSHGRCWLAGSPAGARFSRRTLGCISTARFSSAPRPTVCCCWCMASHFPSSSCSPGGWTRSHPCPAERGAGCVQAPAGSERGGHEEPEQSSLIGES